MGIEGDLKKLPGLKKVRISSQNFIIKPLSQSSSELFFTTSVD